MAPATLFVAISMSLNNAITPPDEGFALPATQFVEQPGPSPDTGFLPEIHVDDADQFGLQLTRRGLLATKHFHGRNREEAFISTRGLKQSPEKDDLYAQARFSAEREADLEAQIQDAFVPQHNPSQFLSPRAFFQSQLFGASNDAIGRRDKVSFALTPPGRGPVITYQGPELRQSDAKVFLALLNMLRDIRLGTLVSIDPESVCIALYRRYNGGTRNQLREHIQRLQHGLIITDKFSVQLCLCFEYPSHGSWSVALDARIVELFRVSPKVWLSMQVRLTLPEGLATWLYCYIQCQTRLIPYPISKIREMCGSTSKPAAFTNSLRAALKILAERNIIDAGWSLRKKEVRWQKARALAADIA